MKVCSCSPQRHNNSILSFSGSPVPAPGSAKAMLDNNPGKSAAVGLSCYLPDYRHYSPPPTKCLRLCSARLGQAGLRACQSWICFPLLQSCVYGICAFVLRCFFFLFSHCTPQWSIVWGLHFFSPPFPHVML